MEAASQTVAQPEAPTVAPPPASPLRVPTARDPGNSPQDVAKTLSALIEKKHAETEATLSALAEKKHLETKAQLEAMAKAMADLFKQALSQAQQAMTDCTKTLGKAEETAKSLSAAQHELKNMLVTETAAAIEARKKLWDEAAKFRNTIYREIRWFIRTPAILLALATVMTVIWLLLRPPRMTTSRSVPTAATAQQNQKAGAASRNATRPSKTFR